MFNLPDCGFLEVILGPMFSGKTTRIIDIYNSEYKQGKNILVINYSGDTRYHNTMLSTHDKVMIPCVFSNTLKDVCSVDDIKNVETILINEGQFFNDLYDVVYELVDTHKKKVFVCGLDGDFKRQKFGSILDLIPICDNVVKLKANCKQCSNYALFSFRKSCEVEQVSIGSDNYIPLCRNCYNKHNKF